MHIKNVQINNFRLLKDANLDFANETTVIVGRNNSGKTSLTEFFRRILSEENWSGVSKASPKFELEDFSASTHADFLTAYNAFKESANPDLEAIRALLPIIKAQITVDYAANLDDFASLGDFIIDLDSELTKAVIVVSYELGEDGVRNLFREIEIEAKAELEAAEEEEVADASEEVAEDASEEVETGDKVGHFYKIMKERVSRLYQIKVHALDPNDPDNKKQLELKDLRTLLAAGFITAQRGLDDKTDKESGLLSKSIENLFTSSLTSMFEEEQSIAVQVEGAVKGMESEIDKQFAEFIKTVISPQFKPFGYPSLQDIPLCTSTSLNVQGILKNFSRIGYAASGKVNLPESYNGLGTRNLIFILLKLYEFMKSYSAQECSAGIQLIFIEEPEAHLHPQMQEVFIKNLNATVKAFSEKFNDGETWPVQFIVTTHSSHLANAAEFSSMRYFSANTCIETDATKRKTEIKDISIGLKETPSEDLEFLHKYMTLTKCDLFFADKMILIEGTSERLMLPKMIEKRDSDIEEDENSLGSDYLSIIEVGGAYAHLFFPLVVFLDIPTLIITDLDSVEEGRTPKDRVAWYKCKVADGDRTSNATLKNWFNEGDEHLPLSHYLAASYDEKVRDTVRIAYQVSEDENPSEDSPCARSFEDAFMLANPELFDLDDSEDIATDAYNEAAKSSDDKSSFALKYAIDETVWNIPKYIQEGLDWLAEMPCSLNAADDNQENAE